tara:strand:- start:266 stop:907 length:642 start_codon:yes stop_codon:yes gene_type:complete
MAKTPKNTHIDFHDLITVFNDIIAKHINNINEKRNEINKLADKNYIITNKYNDQLELTEEAEKELNACEKEKEEIFVLLSQEKAKVRKLEKDLNHQYSGTYLEMKNANKLAHERIKELESTDHFDAAQTYQKELVKAERENKILANELLAITNQTGTKARPKISINVPNPSDSITEAKYVIDKFVDFDHPHTIDILAKHEARIDKEQEEDQWN